MKIAFITSHIFKSTQWTWFSEVLLEKKIEHIHIIIADKYPIMAEELTKLGVKVFVLYHKGKRSLIINLFKIIKILKKENINIVHTELPYGNLLGQLAAYFCGIEKRVSTCENASWGIDYKNKKQILIDKISYYLAQKIITLTDLSKEYIIKHYKQQENKMVTIWHALKIDSYSPISQERITNLMNQLNITNEKFIIGMVARGEEWKGHIYAIQSILLLKERYPNILLLIVGVDIKTNYGKKLQNFVIQNNLMKHVLFVPFVSDNIALYKIFKIHIHVPINEIAETFGITYIEGMISGCPQILTRSGIAYFTAKHLENAYVVDYKNEKQIADGIEFLINNEQLRHYIAENAKNMAQMMFVYSNKVEKHIEVYNTL